MPRSASPSTTSTVAPAAGEDALPRIEDDGIDDSSGDAVDGERRETIRFEVPHQEAHRDVRRHGSTECGDERRPAHAVPLATEEFRQLEDCSGADDRRGE